MRVLVLGPLTILRGDRPVALPGPRETALLALLAARWPRMAATEELIEDLWPAGPPAGATVTLRAYVSTLRRALRTGGVAEAVLTRRGGYALAPALGEGLDAGAFESLLARAQRPPVVTDPAARAQTLAAALELWRGSAFAEVATAPGVASYATYLEERRLVALEHWADAELDRSRHVEIAARLAELCQQNPTRERLWGAWMTALCGAGRRAEALGVYRRLYRHLDDELGITPGSELRELELAILQQRSDLLRPHGGGEPPSARLPAANDIPAALRPPASGPFIGRRRELDHLIAAAELARTGSGPIVALSGEPGVGKTRLLAEAAFHLRDRGFQIAYGRCDGDDARPFVPFLEALRGRMQTVRNGGDPDPSLVALPEPEQREPSDVLASSALEVARRRLFDAIADHVLETAADAPLALMLDDIHWADASSLQMLRHLARRRGQAPLLLVIAYRAQPPAAEGPLGDALTGLRRDPGIRPVELAGLSAAEVHELLAGDTSVSIVSAAELHRLTDGNPLFVRQVVAQRRRDGADDHDGSRREEGLAELSGVRDAIQSRLRLLGDDALAVLTVAALLGDEFELGELEAVEGADASERVLDALEGALRARIIAPVPEAPERYRFHHTLLREGLQDRLGAPRRARLHERIGETLLTLGDGDGRRLGALAGHFAAAARAGHVDRAAEYAVRAGWHAIGQLAFEQAEAIAERGLRCLAIDGSSPTVARCELELLLARSRLLARDITGCKEAAARAGADARALGSISHLGRAAITGAHLNVFGQPSPATRALCEDALATDGALGHAARAQVLAGFADYVAVSEGDAARAEQISADAIEMARRSDDPAALARALFVHCETLEWGPAIDERRRLADELLEVAVDTGDPVGQTNAHHVRALACLELGDVDGFDEEAARIDERRSEAGYWYTDMFALLWRGMRALLRDRIDEAERCSEALLEHARQDANVVNLFMGQLMYLRREQGRFHELHDGLRAAVVASPGVTAFRCALALSDAELGRVDHARAALAQLRPGGFAALPRDSTFTTSLAMLTEAAALSGDRASAAPLALLLRPYGGRVLIATKGMACLGATDRFLGALLALAGRNSESGRRFAAALELERRLGSELLLDRTREARRLAHSAASSHQ